jgi:hypothetical protein
VPRRDRVCEPDRAQLLHVSAHLSEGIVPELRIRFGTDCPPFDLPPVRERSFHCFDRAFACCREIGPVDYALSRIVLAK